MNDNKLIAEFMELPMTQDFVSGKANYYFREFNSGSWYEEHELSYNVSWDWLMPVIHKIKESDLDFDVLEIGLPIDETYKAVVEFINQYNKHER